MSILIGIYINTCDFLENKNLLLLFWCIVFHREQHNERQMLFVMSFVYIAEKEAQAKMQSKLTLDGIADDLPILSSRRK